MNENRSNKVFCYPFILAFIICSFTNNSNANINEGGEKTLIYQKGIEALKTKDTVKAVKYFQESIQRYNDAASNFLLAKIYLNRNSFNYRNKAYEHFRKAVLIEPKNIEYGIAFASLMKDFARRSSEAEFKRIIALDSMFVDAWLNLGKLKDEDFTEYNNSVRKMSDEFYGSLQEYALDDFNEAEKYYQTVLQIDSTNYDANLKLALLYEKIGEPEKGIPLLNRLVIVNKNDKDVHLCLGLLKYKTQKIRESYEEYKTALNMMNEEERLDFTFNSVKFLIEPAFENIVANFSDYELRQFINAYWKFFDPLYMTDYNERMLEHYSRVAFAQLHFSLPRLGKPGWKTDRGEAVLRYGEPLNFMRIRPSMESTGVNVKTEVWNYNEMTLGFTDMASSGNYQFSAPDAPKSKLHTQFAGDTQFFIENLRRVKHTFYDPKFEGPKFDVEYSFVQFKNYEKRNHTDLYVNYNLATPDSLFGKNISTIKYNTGLFFFDKNYEEQFRNLSSFEIKKGDGEMLTKTHHTIARSDSGYASFEIIREHDKGTFANRTNLKIKKFNQQRLDISDVLLANYSGTDASKGAVFVRRGISINPNPSDEFTKDEPLFIYYEVYNLKKDAEGLTNFEQKISIREYEEKPSSDLENAAAAVIKFLGIGRNEEITLTSKYKTLETDPQIYLQLDLSKYEPGKYEIIVSIKDILQDKEVVANTIVNWKN